jgi:hypothetical protein
VTARGVVTERDPDAPFAEVDAEQARHGVTGSLSVTEIRKS